LRATYFLVRACAAIGILVVIVTFTPIVSWWAARLAGPWNDPTGDTLVVLGGSMIEDGVMGESSYWRSTYALLAYRERAFSQIVVSGGNGSAEAMKSFLECRGVPAGIIRTEVRSTSTRENAIYTSELLSKPRGTIVLLTSDYHMFRAYRVFKKAGLTVLPRPFPDALKRANSLANRWGAFLDVAGETAAIAYYLARGWL
jgi:uncharacterized SAM-binding protein YcdF (DUF218 family)